MDRAETIQNIIENMARCQRPAMTKAWQSAGLSHAEVSMLFMLYYHQNISAKQVAEYLGISKSAVSQLLDPLEDKKLINRSRSANDRRIVLLELTAAGRQSIKKVQKLKFAGLRSSLDNLTDSELAQMAGLYQKMSAKTDKQN
ncbi:MAG TPA: MarR family transcriptional regulator [Candidatus Binatia bacterium]|nr:MarR family transcriptional regulator [Candidatus Binatia bacterium]